MKNCYPIKSIIKNQNSKFMLIIFLIIFYSSNYSSAKDGYTNKNYIKDIFKISTNELNSNNQSSEEMYISVYHGQSVDNSLKEIIFEGKREYMSSYVNIIALSSSRVTQFPNLHFEKEILLAKHTGMQHHLETDLAINFRWQFVNEPFPLSLGYGNGISYAEKTPKLELAKGHDDTKRLLGYIMVDFEIEIPLLPTKPKVFFRIHHRSGILGLFCRCGSNFPSFGYKSKI